MQDRPDLIESELSGLAFDSLQQVFKPEHLEVMFNQPMPAVIVNEDIHLFIDPAAGGPYSDYAMLSVTRQKGLITVRPRRPLRRLEVPARGVLGVPVGPVQRERAVARHQRAVRRGRARGLAAQQGERARQRVEERRGGEGGEHGPGPPGRNLYSCWVPPVPPSLTDQVQHAHPVHELVQRHALVPHPRGQRLVVQRRVEAGRLLLAHRAPAARHLRLELAEPLPRPLVLRAARQSRAVV